MHTKKIRAQRMLSSVPQMTSRALGSALLLGIAAVLGGCTGTTGADGSVQTDGAALRGKVVSYIATFDDGTAETQYFIVPSYDDNQELRLRFERDPELVSGASIALWGAEDVDGFVVDRFELLSPPGSDTGRTRQPLINGEKMPDKRFAMVLVDTGNGVNITEATARARVFGTGASDASVKQFYLEASYGVQDLGGDVFGPFSYPMTNCDTQGMARSLRSQIGTNIDHYLWYLGNRTSSCGWAGLAQAGSPDNPARDTWYNGSSSCVVLIQEPGHNFGMMHSSFLDCGSAVFADNPNSCQHDEYGNRYDPMGGGCRHMNAWQKAYQGWFGGCNSVRIGTSATYTLLPLETPCDGTQVLQIPMPRARSFNRPAGGGGGAGVAQMRYYYLELRTKVGFDASMTNAPTVLVHVGDDYRTSRQIGLHTWILDMNPSTSTIDGLGAGQSYTDPSGGVSFRVETLSGASASIAVQVMNGSGTNTCLDGKTLTAPGPATCGATTPDGMGGASGMGGAGQGGASQGGATAKGGAGGAGFGGNANRGGTNAGGNAGMNAGGASQGGVAGRPQGGATSAGTAGAGGTAGGGGVAGGVTAGTTQGGFAGTAGAGGSAGAVATAAGAGGFVSASGGAPTVGLGGALGTGGSIFPGSGGVTLPASGGSSGASTSVAGSTAVPPFVPADPGSGCGCRLPGNDAGSPRGAGGWVAVAGLALAALRRRRLAR